MCLSFLLLSVRISVSKFKFAMSSALVVHAFKRSLLRIKVNSGKFRGCFRISSNFLKSHIAPHRVMLMKTYVLEVQVSQLFLVHVFTYALYLKIETLHE